jgi:hypothetical protein
MSSLLLCTVRVREQLHLPGGREAHLPRRQRGSLLKTSFSNVVFAFMYSLCSRAAASVWRARSTSTSAATRTSCGPSWERGASTSTRPTRCESEIGLREHSTVVGTYFDGLGPSRHAEIDANKFLLAWDVFKNESFAG